MFLGSDSAAGFRVERARDLSLEQWPASQPRCPCSKCDPSFINEYKEKSVALPGNAKITYEDTEQPKVIHVVHIYFSLRVLANAASAHGSRRTALNA